MALQDALQAVCRQSVWADCRIGHRAAPQIRHSVQVLGPQAIDRRVALTGRRIQMIVAAGVRQSGYRTALADRRIQMIVAEDVR